MLATALKKKEEALLQQGKEQGLQQGIQKGKWETARETARKLKERGMEVQSIADVTGLRVEEVERL